MGANDATGTGLLEFLAWAAEKGEMAGNTAQALMTASRRVLGIFEDLDEVSIRELDVPNTLARFENLNRTKYSQASMLAYKRRFEQAARAYLAWLDSDPNWNTIGRASRESRPIQRPKPLKKSKQKLRNEEPAAIEAPQNITAPGAAPASMVAYDLPLRPDLLVRITLPIDLTVSDADRISAFVRSLAFAAPGPSGTTRHDGTG